jgi:arylsulfatase A-like enzyme
MIIILSDHGEEFYEHHGWGHGYSLYNEVLHVPLIIKFPNSRYRGRTITSNVSLIDVFPTILDFFKIDISHPVDGHSLLNCLNQKGRGNRKIVSILKFETDKKKPSQIPEKISIVYKKYKIIYNFKYSQEAMDFFGKFPPPEYRQYELYDIQNDYRERTNLAYTVEHRRVFEELKKDIEKIITKIQSAGRKRPLLKHEEEELQKLKEMGYL